MRHLRTTIRFAAAGILIMAAQAAAQTTGSAPPDKSDEHNSPAHFDSQGKKGADQTLSERLDRTDGVIRPPNHVDREIVQAPPATGDGGMAIKPPRDGGEQLPKPK